MHDKRNQIVNIDKMRAARYYGKEDLRVEEIEEPKCGPGQIKIRPAFVGICGTDLHEYIGGPNFAPVNPHPVSILCSSSIGLPRVECLVMMNR